MVDDRQEMHLSPHFRAYGARSSAFLLAVTSIPPRAQRNRSRGILGTRNKLQSPRLRAKSGPADFTWSICTRSPPLRQEKKAFPIARIQHPDKWGLRRVNQYRPRILNVSAARLRAASTATSHLLSQPNVVELHTSYAAGGNRGVSRTEAEGN